MSERVTTAPAEFAYCAVTVFVPEEAGSVSP